MKLSEIGFCQVGLRLGGPQTLVTSKMILLLPPRTILAPLGVILSPLRVQELCEAL